MGSVLDFCKPRAEIIAGNFNPEIFTASLSPIIAYYRDNVSRLDNIYTDANQFFTDATYPTQGLRTILYEVFARLSGDATVPAIHRLETAFGGGKTHALIACAHIAKRGNSISGAAKGFLPSNLFPDRGSVTLVGVAGEEIPVHRPKGKELVPYTLWGEIAYQVGGEPLYQTVEEEAGSYAAPGKIYFEKVLGERKILIMLDELAQYAARLEAARPDGASQLAAFLMALHGYARNRPGIAIVLTLASSIDAFAKQTGHLAQLLSKVRGDEVSEIDALGIGERAVKGVASVVARDAVQVTPVQAGELSSVLAKRLFVSIDHEKVNQTTLAYMEMYRRNSSALPEVATRDDFKDRMKASYPFHPTLLDFLNYKLADAENFQGTRGVLRVLSMAVRRLWETRLPVPMIHACHLDLRSERVINEILGRTGSSDLLFVLNADVGGVDTGSLEGARSNAELAGLKNPHPDGLPYYEYAWKTVFLHSLVGRDEGLQSKIFGMTEQEALFAVSFPGFPPSQVGMALEEITRSAFYLRFEQGKYYASKQPTINSVLARIRQAVSASQVDSVIKKASRKVIADGTGPFSIIHDVEFPEDIPEGKTKPMLGVVSLKAQTVDMEALFTTKGIHVPREKQNLVYLLAPAAVHVEQAPQQRLFKEQEQATLDQESRRRLEYLARQVVAIHMLLDNPQNYGVNPSRLEEEDCKKNFPQFENDLMTVVAKQYNALYYPSTAGEIAQREIATGGGEGGAPFIELIRQILLKDGKLLTASQTTQSDLLNLSKLFFAQGDTAILENMRQNFLCLRSWPVLEEPGLFEQLIRAGVQKDVWSLYRMGSDENVKPDEFYCRDNEIPMGVDLSQKGYGIITPQGAKQRGWGEGEKVGISEIKGCVTNFIADNGLASVAQAYQSVIEKYGEVPESDVQEAISILVRDERLFTFQGDPDLIDKPDLIYGSAAVLYSPRLDDMLITPALAAEKGWVSVEQRIFTLTGKEGAEIIMPLLGQLGSIYNRGAQSRINNLDLVDLQLKSGGLLRLQLTDVSLEGMKSLGEFFEVLDGIILTDENSEVFLRIIDPVEGCLLMKELKDGDGEGTQDG